jgi:hypothetical protein
VADPFTIAYVSGAATLVAAELWAVARQKGGTTITQKTKATPVTHAAMASLLTWGAFHFTLDDYLDSGPSANLLTALVGGTLGLAAYRHRNR